MFYRGCIKAKKLKRDLAQKQVKKKSPIAHLSWLTKILDGDLYPSAKMTDEQVSNDHKWDLSAVLLSVALCVSFIMNLNVWW